MSKRQVTIETCWSLDLHIIDLPGFFVGRYCDPGPDFVPKCHGSGRRCIQSPYGEIFTCFCAEGYVGSSESCAGTNITSLKSKYTYNA